ncbi:hypothetical protein NB620_15935 [Vibrio alginolyticus]|uniref:Cap15 family cyclic dinucleotide receptor domain-containing protein n=1 Tax=Vibrio alginolyticus TaxID=663 RepID=UPI0006CF2F71|nr:hypothetical protein [Vibrio alginolyticus]ELB2282491.1 hypothetical protein [Vibrio alginolyticus]MCS0001761.1 hypothetical protein [Vibrio alginolyticus]
MINLLPIGKVITVIAILYAATMAAFLSIRVNQDSGLLENILFSVKGSAILNLLLLFSFYLGWRWLWKVIPSLNHILFPDLNGEWDMEIHWNSGNAQGTALATAYIKQDFLKISMEVISKDSESHTLLAKPKKDPESGRATLIYMYRNVPKRKNGNQEPPYDGTAVLKLGYKDTNKLMGNYYTDRLTQGHYELKRR